MREISWKKIVGLSALLAALLALAIADWKGLEAIRNLRAETAALRELVIQTNRVAVEESSAAVAASQRATEAAARADAAAGARQQAEQKSQQAISSAQQATEEAARANQELERLHRERQQELDHMQEALSRIAETHRTPRGMVIVLPDSSFRFPFDSVDLNGNNRELLSRVAGILLVSKGYGLSVFGYTDDVGSEAYNRELSVRRADAVRQYLVRSGIDPAIITRRGFGKSSPLVPGSTPAARARNRRVEIAVTDSSISYGDQPTVTK